MASRFKVNKAGMRKITRTMGGAACQAGAERGKKWAEANSPVRTGEYQGSFEVVPADVTVAGETRKGARLVNTSDHAKWVEWGRGAKHVLARSVDVIEKG